jgi:hypothetical protein
MPRRNPSRVRTCRTPQEKQKIVSVKVFRSRI